MPLFRKKYDPGRFQGPSTTRTPTRYSANYNLYDPRRFNAADSRYGTSEGQGITALGNIVSQGGFSPEQTQRMAQGFETALSQGGEDARLRARQNLAARGVLDSGAALRTLGNIDRDEALARSQFYGGMAQEGARQVIPAAQTLQAGTQLEAERLQNYNALKAQLSMTDAQLQTTLQQINATLDMSDADRELRLAEIANQYNLDRQSMLALQDQAQRDRRASFFSNLFGGALGAAGQIGGAVIGNRGLESLANAVRFFGQGAPSGLNAFGGL